MAPKKGAKKTYEVYKKPDADSVQYVPPKAQRENPPPPQAAPALSPSPNASSSSSRAKTKYTVMDLNKLREGLLPGRHACKCLASRHKLLINCLGCGRIVCEQEGTGPCMTCGRDLFDKKQQGRISQAIKDKIDSQGMDSITPAEVQALFAQEERDRAEKYKNKLLEFDRSSAKRTRVIDDETDYYSSETNSWLSGSERERLKAKEASIQEARDRQKERKVTIDLAGRRVIETSEVSGLEAELRDQYQEELSNLQGSAPTPGSASAAAPAAAVAAAVPAPGTGLFSHPGRKLANEMRPVFVNTGAKKQGQGDREPPLTKASFERIQHDYEDEALVGLAERAPDSGEEEDLGLCLSMWQPWATLLVFGIKQVEGRSWPTNHRGRLWIAAAAKKPTPEELRVVVEQHMAQNPKEKKPKMYPTSCIVGCVDIVDCLSQEEYQQKHRDPSQRQSESPFVFICQNAVAFHTPLPASGQQKIWNLSTDLLRKCKAALDDPRNIRQ